MGKINRILFIGNSITKHEPKPVIGWYGNWGMAASIEESDYVHILMKKVKIYNSEATYTIKTIVDFETEFWNYNMDKLKDIQNYNADLIILRIAENVNDFEAGKRDFGIYYKKIIDTMNPSMTSIIICTNSFWENPNVNSQIKKVSDENGFIFIDLSELRINETNMAKDEFDHEGVGLHPSDKGMKEIASLIWEKIEKFL